METPIYTRLIEYHKKNRISFAMPGHKNLRGLAPDLQKCDVTELPATVDLHHEDGSVMRACELLSELYGTRRSFILTGGSTTGIQAMLSSVLRPGDTLCAAADCHMSVINTCALCGYKLILLPVKTDPEYMIPTGLEIDALPDEADVLLITSPNYYGITRDINKLSKMCRAAGIPLLVDEAHGAHFIASDRLPDSAVELGADIVCQSAHKTLNALTGAAYLHVCGKNIDAQRVHRSICAFESSSPSYPIAASADAARATLAKTCYDEIIDECNEFCKAVCYATKVRSVNTDDPTRIVLCFSEYETSGYEILKKLSDYYGIDAEMADMFNIVLIATPWNKHSDFMNLFRAIRDITEGLRPRIEKRAQYGTFSEIIKADPQKGWFADSELIPLEETEGRTAAAPVSVYPPGTAVIVTGCVIDRKQIEFIKENREAGAEIDGMKDGKIEVVK